MIEFLVDNRATFTRANELFKKASKIRCAVAFWGDGAEKLLSNIPANEIRLICNLMTGGTNPKVIERILKQSTVPNIKMLDVLHAKVYWTEHGAIIGSANASSNGLGFESIEVRGWKEASLFVDDASLLVEIELWFDSLWALSSLITKNDMLLAKAKWTSRRKNLPPTPSGSGTLADDIRNGFFTGRPVHIIIDTVFMSPKQRVQGDKKGKGISRINPLILADSISYWLDYPKVPRNKITYCYYVENGKIQFDGAFRTLEKKYDQRFDKNSSFQYCVAMKQEDMPIIGEKLKELLSRVNIYYKKNCARIEINEGAEFKVEKLFSVSELKRNVETNES